jgi:hypothetical protein
MCEKPTSRADEFFTLAIAAIYMTAVSALSAAMGVVDFNRDLSLLCSEILAL